MFYPLSSPWYSDNQQGPTSRKKGPDRGEIILSKTIAEPVVATLDELIAGEDDRYNELASYLVRNEILLGETTVTAGHVRTIVSISFNGQTYRMSKRQFFKK